MVPDQSEHEGGGYDGRTQEGAVVPPAPPLLPVQFWLEASRRTK